MIARMRMHLLGGITQRNETHGRGFGIVSGWSLNLIFIPLPRPLVTLGRRFAASGGDFV